MDSRLKWVKSFFGIWLSKIRKPHVLRNCYGNVDTFTNNFVTSVFIKEYRRVYWKVEVKLFFFLSTNAQISNFEFEFSKSTK